MAQAPIVIPVVYSSHDWEIHSYSKPTDCVHCEKLLWGVVKQGIKCKRCKQSVHEKCRISFEAKACPAPANPFSGSMSSIAPLTLVAATSGSRSSLDLLRNPSIIARPEPKQAEDNESHSSAASSPSPLTPSPVSLASSSSFLLAPPSPHNPPAPNLEENNEEIEARAEKQQDKKPEIASVPLAAPSPAAPSPAAPSPAAPVAPSPAAPVAPSPAAPAAPVKRSPLPSPPSPAPVSSPVIAPTPVPPTPMVVAPLSTPPAGAPSPTPVPSSSSVSDAAEAAVNKAKEAAAVASEAFSHGISKTTELFKEIAAEAAREEVKQASQQVKEEPSLNLLTTTPANFSKFVPRVGPIVDFSEALRDLLFWKNVPSSAFVLSTWLFLCFNPSFAAFVPLMAAIGFISKLYMNRQRLLASADAALSKGDKKLHKTLTQSSSSTDFYVESLVKSANLSRNMRFIQNSMGLYSTTVDAICVSLHRLDFSNEQESSRLAKLLVSACAAAGFVLWIVPARLLFAMAGIALFSSQNAMARGLASFGMQRVMALLQQKNGPVVATPSAAASVSSPKVKSS